MLKICFRTRMAFLLWRCQFDCLGRISLNTPLQPLDWYEWETVEERKHKTMSSIQYSVTDGNMLLHWSKVSSNLRFTQTLNIAFTVLLLCICEVVAVNCLSQFNIYNSFKFVSAGKWPWYKQFFASMSCINIVYYTASHGSYLTY